ncbi:MAG: sigma-54-dependent Fis family transcriptional regulator [Deltaproteobacteria bacterium]|nr:sigma-54-dependent Fis family transcriptional regulator [Deltaproteobacteria bacterium]
MTTQERQILIVDDEAPMRHMLRMVLERDGYTVAEAVSGRQGLDRLQAGHYSLILCDIRMPEMDGLTFLKEKHGQQFGGTVIMMSAYGSIDTAVECMKMGAYDYISKPFRPDEILLTVRKAEERLQLRQENVQLKKNMRRDSRPQGVAAIVHRSALMQGVLEMVKKAAEAPVPVLITGPTGTGKELIARALHAESPRRDKPFLAVNCSAIPAGLLESELFGHAKGAFTGADRARAGLFGAADGGTLLLDEIGDLPLELQPKLLRVLQEREVRRIGESKSTPVDVRVITATGKNLSQAVADGSFREDLFYRLAVISIELPALSQRREDISVLVESYLPRIAARLKRPVPAISSAALNKLEKQPWPGNVRELLNVLEKTLVLCHEETINESDLVLHDHPQMPIDATTLSLKKATVDLERDYIQKALTVTGGNRTQAAKILEISLRSLIYKIKDYGL